MRKKLIFIIPIFIFFSLLSYVLVNNHILAINANATNKVVIEDKKYDELGSVGNCLLYKRSGDFVTAQALEFIYEEQGEKYFLRSMESGLYLIKCGDHYYGLKESLNEKKVTIEELMESPLKERIIVEDSEM